MAHPGAGPEGFFGHADGSQEPPSPKLLGAGCPGSGVSGGQRGFDKRSDCVEGLKDQRISTREIFSIRMAMSDKVLVCGRSEEHKSELQSLMRISYAVF